MRSFIAVELPENIKKSLYETAKNLYEKNLFKGKITEKENLHLTLKFLGEVENSKLEEVKKSLREIKIKKFKAGICEFGVFNENYVKIIWVHLLGAENLQKEIDENLVDMFEKENRFMGHITIARVKSCYKRELIEEVKKLKLEKEFEVDEFSLVSSELTSSGPIYEIIEKFKLG